MTNRLTRSIRPTSLTALALGATALAATSVTAAAAQTPPASQQQQEDAEATPARVSGENRYATAAAVARLHHTQAEDVIVAIGSDFADALSASAWAGTLDAPVLLVEHDRIPQVTLDTMDDLGTVRVTIMGGTAAVSSSVEDELRDHGYETGRLRGDSRYGTAAAVAREVQEAQENGANFPGGQRAVFLASGEGFADALAAAPLASSSPSPIPLVLTAEDSLPEATRDVLVDLDIELAVIVGGTNAVSDDVRQQVEDLGINTDRVRGENRTATAVAVAEFAEQYLDFDLDEVLLARGTTFPDALAAGPYAGDQASPVLLAASSEFLGPHTEDKLVTTCNTIDVVRAVGGRAAIASSTLQQAVDAADACSETDRPEDGQTFLVTPQERLEREAGEAAEFGVPRTTDGQQLAQAIDVTLLPCENTDVVGAGGDTFADRDDDAHADGIGSSNEDLATITAINGEPVAPGTTYVQDVAPTSEGVTFEVTAGGEDCATVLVLDDEDDDQAFDLFANEASEPYGVGQVAWSAPA